MKPANLRRRLIAFVLDYLLILLYIVLLAAATSLLLFSPPGERVLALIDTPLRRDVLAFITLILPVGLYFAISESRPYGATWGKRRLALKVFHNEQAEPPGFGRSLLRTALKLLPWQLAHTALFNIPGWPIAPQEPPVWVLVLFGLVWLLVLLYWLSALLSSQRQTLYDRISGTYVGVQSNTD